MIHVTALEAFQEHEVASAVLNLPPEFATVCVAGFREKLQLPGLLVVDVLDELAEVVLVELVEVVLVELVEVVLVELVEVVLVGLVVVVLVGLIVVVLVELVVGVLGMDVVAGVWTAGVLTTNVRGLVPAQSLMIASGVQFRPSRVIGPE